MCDGKISSQNQECENIVKEKFYADVSIITKKSFLRYIKGHPRQEYRPPWPPPNSNVYPKANMYYAFNEDTNPFTRLEDFGKCSGYCGPHFKPLEEPFTNRDPYYEEEARRKYIATKPAAFVIFGKPGLSSAKLASMIAEAWGCILISPEVLIKEEIDRRTDKGRYIAEVLKSGKCVGPEIIMNLVESRVRMRDVMHRGYIVEGFPFIPNETLDYSSYPEHYDSSSFVETCTDKVDYQRGVSLKMTSKCFDEKEMENDVKSEKLTCQDSISTLSGECRVPPSSTCKVATNYKHEICRQIDNIFTAWPIKPTVIIYIMCPNQDVIRKREQLRLDAHSGRVVNTAFLDVSDNAQSNFPHENNKGTDEFSVEFYPEIMDEYTTLEEEQKRHFLLRISDMKSNVDAQCKIYEEVAMPVVEKWVLAHNPQNVLRIDGRTSLSKMFEIVSVRLRILPIPRLFLPKLMIDPVEFEMQSEDAVATTLEGDFDDIESREAIQELANRGSISARFPWRLSAWNLLCPVELAKGITIQGRPKYAVRFMNKFFFLSSKEASDLFIENPRPFLLPPNPRPACRIIIFGPRYSGKSEISSILAQKFGGYVIDVNEAEKCLAEDKINMKITDAMRHMVRDVIKDLRTFLETEREGREASRMAKIQAWFDDACIVVAELFNVKSEPNTDVQQQKLKDIQLKLRKHNLAKLLTDRKFRRRVKQNVEVLYDYMPEHLKTEEPAVRELTEHDPEVVSILEDHVNYMRYERIDLTADEKAEMIIDKIKMSPEEPIDTDVYRDNGFIIDGLFLDPGIWKKFLESNIVFEDIIVLWEDEPFDYLIEKWHHMRKRGRSSNENSRMSTNNAPDEYEGEGGYMSQEMIELEQYIAELRQFTFQWRNMKDTIKASGKNVIICDLRTVHDIPEYIESNINNRYAVKAHVMTEKEKETERMIEDMAALENFSVKQYLEAEDYNQDIDEEEKMDVRRLGDTSYYCPVALSAHNVLWKGKEEFSVTYEDKIYMLSSASALELFLENPRSFSVPFSRPPLVIPPLRISIVGSAGSGKTALADGISREYGLTHVDYFARLIGFMEERKLLPPGSKHSLVVLENYDNIVELPEDLTDEKYNTDRATVRTFIHKYIQNGGILPNVLRRECLINFFQPPYDKHGLILDGFPTCKEDVELMLEKCIVPEIIIEIHCSSDTALQRKLPDLFEVWTQSQEEKKHFEKARYNNAVSLYESSREKWVKKMLTERRKQRLADVGTTRETEEECEFDQQAIKIHIETAESAYSLLRSEDSEIFDPDPEQAIIDRIELEEAWKFEHPGPELFTDWEDFETAQIRITEQLEMKYETDALKLASMRTVMESESIPWIEIDGEQNERTVLLKALKTLGPYVFRDTSIFERCYRVDPENAERLLEYGYYFLSSFGRFCPVQLYGRKNPIPMFFPMEANEEICPVIHRQYIYFFSSKESCSTFMKNPLKYIEQDSCVPLIPLKISIIGPPKCGKTTLAERFAKTYGLKLITRGKALRHMLKNFSWTELAGLMEAHLRSGQTALNESIGRAVEMYSINSRSASQGYVLDGFPTSRPESEDLAFLGIQPMIVIDLKANLDFCLECLSFDEDEESLKRPANFSSSFIAHRYAEWYKDQDNFRDWLMRFSQNITEIDATKSKWYIWSRADNAVRSKYTEILRYFREADYDKVHKLTSMCISPYEFRQRQSIYESYCPICLYLEDTMNFSGTPPDRRNVLQFREFFYWLCSRHIDNFIEDPLKYLPPVNNATLPTDRPEILEETVDPEHACWAKRLKAGGFCLVHYVDNLPNRSLIPGKPNLSGIYQDKVYLFCSEVCRKKFLSLYKKYANVDINFRRMLPPIDIWTLPDLGFLEQTMAGLVVRAVKYVGIKRPKIPGLSVSATAAIYIGVFLKVHNDSCALEEVDVYEKVSACLEARAHIINVATRGMKRKINPHVTVPKQTNPSGRLDERISMISQVSSRTINFIKFRRTSPTQTLIDPDDVEH